MCIFFLAECPRITGADEGTRTHTLTHENLNLACLPIPSHLQMVAYFGLEPTSSDYKSDALTN